MSSRPTQLKNEIFPKLIPMLLKAADENAAKRTGENELRARVDEADPKHPPCGLGLGC